MEPLRFDGIRDFLTTGRRSRRTALQHGATAQDATPAADADGTPGTMEYLFVQSFESGTIAPKEGADGTYTVTLLDGLGQTVYFSDRPERNVGATPTPQFLDGLGFSADNPPNAALVIGAEGGGSDIAVVELTNPSYDTTSSTAFYDITVLENFGNKMDMQLQKARADLASVASSFGSAHLFIDDCADAQDYCRHWNSDGYIIEADDPSLGVHGMCSSQLFAICEPCHATTLDRMCTNEFPEFCTSDAPCAVSP